MKTITLLLGAGALAALSAGTAAAGPCTTEIDNVTKLLSLHGCRRRTDRRRSERDHGSASAERDHGCGRHEHGGIVCSGAIGATAASAHSDCPSSEILGQEAA